MKRNIFIIGVVLLVVGILVYQSAQNQIEEIMNIARDNRRAVGGARFSQEVLQEMNDRAQVTLLFSRGLVGFSGILIIYAIYGDLVRLIEKRKS